MAGRLNDCSDPPKITPEGQRKPRPRRARFRGAPRDVLSGTEERFERHRGTLLREVLKDVLKGAEGRFERRLRTLGGELSCQRRSRASRAGRKLLSVRYLQNRRGCRRPAPHPIAAPSRSGMTVSANRSISSSCGLNCSSSRSTPADSRSRMRSATFSGVPTRPARSPRFETE